MNYNYGRANGVPKDSGGSYTPPEIMPEDGTPLKQFLIKEKICDMMKYALPVTDKFPRRCRYIADQMRSLMAEMLSLAIRMEKRYYKKTTLEDLDITLETLRNFIVIASDPDFTGPKYAPVLSMHQREVWSRYTTEIGRMIGGYKKYVDAHPAKNK